MYITESAFTHTNTKTSDPVIRVSYEKCRCRRHRERKLLFGFGNRYQEVAGHSKPSSIFLIDRRTEILQKKKDVDLPWASTIEEHSLSRSHH